MSRKRREQNAQPGAAAALPLPDQITASLSVADTPRGRQPVPS